MSQPLRAISHRVNRFRKTLIQSALASLGAVALCAALPNAVAQTAKPTKISDDVVRLGLLLDMSGLYADLTGEGSVTIARMAVEDFGGTVLGKKIEIVHADHQNKADIAAAKAREWFDNGQVDMIADVAASATALAAANVAKEKGRIAMFSGPGTSRLTNENCSPYNVHYSWDTVALSNVTGKGVIKNGGDTWFFLAADYAFGQSLEKDATEVVKGAGGKVIGSVRHPLNTTDFSSFLLQAQASKAKVVALANAGGDTINSIKAAHEFGLTQKQTLAGLLVFINDVHSLGLQTAQNMMLTESFYWDMNDETRKWSKRFFEKTKKMPNMIQAGTYSSILHYLNGVKATGTDDSDTVMAWMKSNPINDVFVKNGKIREDGRMMREMYLFQVKKPAESKYPWDYYKLLATIPAEDSYLPAAKSVCPLIKK